MTRSAVPLAALTVAVAGCSLGLPGDDYDPVACTMEFRYATVQVLDAAARPVSDASMDVIRVSTGRSIVCTSEGQRGCLQSGAAGPPGAQGYYTVFHDGLDAARLGESFRVVATRGQSRAEEVLSFAHDACHMEKMGGPNRLVLAP